MAIHPGGVQHCAGISSSRETAPSGLFDVMSSRAIYDKLGNRWSIHQISWWYFQDFVDAPEFDKYARRCYRIPRSPRGRRRSASNWTGPSMGVLASTLGEPDSWRLPFWRLMLVPELSRQGVCFHVYSWPGCAA